jgi:hypothetical protein
MDFVIISEKNSGIVEILGQDQYFDISIYALEVSWAGRWMFFRWGLYRWIRLRQEGSKNGEVTPFRLKKRKLTILEG